ncbi:MAG: invasion associated locus B family protein [Pseudomonadota bacterium]
MRFAAVSSSLAAFSGALALGAVANAAKPEPVATHTDWSVFVQDVEGEKVCFAATEAKDKSPKTVNHGDVFFMVASWKSGAANQQPSLMASYNFKDAPEPIARIGSDKWEMYVSENEAFIEKESDENNLVGAMKRGADMRVSAVSSRGTATNYRISLRGITAALKDVDRLCR